MRILYIEDNPDDALILKEKLKDVDMPYNLFFAESLEEGIKRLAEKDIDVILLDLFLPDSRGLDTLRKIQVQEPKPSLPVVLMTGLDDEKLAVKALDAGAQDYIAKGQYTGPLLFRVLRYAIQRHALTEELKMLAVTDELTKLYNRHGFFQLAEQQLKLAQRFKKKAALIYADLDNLRLINDTLGHQEGDLALIDIADILRNTFRSEDIIARISGDDFVVLMIESSDYDVDNAIDRFQENIAENNTKKNTRYTLSLSWGMSQYNPEEPCHIDKLVSAAEELMCRQKAEKRQAKK